MDLSIYPISFFVSALALIGASLFAWKHRQNGWGLPMLAVLATVAAWYHGDGLYNDYEEYQVILGDDALNAGWWMVLLFILTFSFLVLPVHRAINGRLLGRRSRLLFYAKTGKITDPSIQRNIDQVAKALLVCWIALMTIALQRKGWDFMGMFFPYLEGYQLNPWARGRLGGGISALLSLGSYLQILLAAGFGVIAALARNPQTRLMAITICFLALPYFIFDRTRNPMIATMLPGFLAWVFLRLRVRMIVKGAIMLAAFLLANFWFKAVVASDMNRGKSVAHAVQVIASNQDAEAEEEQKIEDLGGGEDKRDRSKHKGLNMFVELAYMSNLFADGLFQPSWGGRYFAEAVNVIPRGLWKNKPLVGVDYALARGFGGERGTTEKGAGITASIATGMIGQGVVNFGRLLGPMAAALLMSIWVAVLARLDLRGDIGRLVLCAVGMILTFNMGRDITLFVLYPFVFGYMLLLGWEWWRKGKMHTQMPTTKRRRQPLADR